MELRNRVARRPLILAALALLILTLVMVASVTPTAGQDSGSGVNGTDDHGNCVCWLSDNTTITGSIGATATPEPDPTVEPQS